VIFHFQKNNKNYKKISKFLEKNFELIKKFKFLTFDYENRLYKNKSRSL